MRQLIERNTEAFQIRAGPLAKPILTLCTFKSTVVESIKFTPMLAGGTASTTLPAECTKIDSTFRTAIGQHNRTDFRGRFRHRLRIRRYQTLLNYLKQKALRLRRRAFQFYRCRSANRPLLLKYRLRPAPRPIARCLLRASSRRAEYRRRPS